MDSATWTIQAEEYSKYIDNFKSLNPQENYVPGGAAREFFLKSSLPKAELARVWELADITRDGKLDLTEFCIAMQLIRKRVKGAVVPDRLPGALQPVRVGLESRNALKNLSSSGGGGGTNGARASTPQPASADTLSMRSGTSSNGGIMDLNGTTATLQRPTPAVANLTETAANRSLIMPPPKQSVTSIHSGNFPLSAFASPVSSAPAAGAVPGPPSFISLTSVANNTNDFTSSPQANNLFSSGQQQQQSGGLSSLIFESHQPPAFNSAPSAINQLSQELSFDATGFNTASFPAASPMSSAQSWNRNAAPANLLHQAGTTYISPGNTAAAPVMPAAGAARHSAYVTYIPAPSAEWEIPQPMRLRYNQAFHEAMKASSFGRASAGLHMPGAQAKNIMLKSGVADQSILAHIWNLSDLDADGALSSDEFCVAMHLLDAAKLGHRLPDMLPPLLVPPSYRRWWHQEGGNKMTTNIANSVTFQHGTPQQQQQAAVGASNNSSGLPSVATGGADSGYAEGEFAALRQLDKDDMASQLKSFEDRRRENFSRGQAELDRRRQHLMEMDRHEKEERERRERAAEAERQRHREEIERRQMQIEMERRMQQQLELERQQEELRKRREAAVIDSERQRYTELLRTRKHLLAIQRQRLQDDVQGVKQKLKQHDAEREENELRNTTLNEELEQLRESVRERKGIIDGMREIRDQMVQGIEQAKHDKNEWQGKLNYLRSERGALSGRKSALEHQDAFADSLRSVDNSCKIRRETVDELSEKMSTMEKSTREKLNAVDDYNNKMQRIQQDFTELMQLNVKLCERYTEKRGKVNKRMRRQPQPQQHPSSNINTVAASADKSVVWPPQSLATTTTTTTSDRVKYRALYAFQARNEDEVSFQPGDIVIVSTDAGELEPGWVFGQVTNASPFGDEKSVKSGWLPANHVDLVNAAVDFESPNAATVTAPFQHDPFALAAGATFGHSNNDDAFGGATAANNSAVDAAATANAFDSGAFDDKQQNNGAAWAAFPPADSSAAHNDSAATSDAFAVPDFQNRFSAEPSTLRNTASPPFSAASSTSKAASAFPLPDAFTPVTTATSHSSSGIKPHHHQSRHPSNNSANSSNTPTGTGTGSGGGGAVNTATKIAMTLYPWTAKKDNHATFNKGEMVVIKKQVGGWCYGEPNQTKKSGWFPAAYVEIIKELPTTAAANGGDAIDSSSYHADLQQPDVNSGNLQLAPPPSGKSGAKMVNKSEKSGTDADLYQAEFEFQSDVPGDLSFRIGELIHVTRRDGEWWSGYISDASSRSGIFPANFVVAKTHETPTKSAGSQQQPAPSMPLSNRHSRSTSKAAAPSAAVAAAKASSGNTTPTVSKSVPSFQPVVNAPQQDVYQALAPFKAAGPEQMSLEKGDLIAVRQKSSTGWWEGELVSRGGVEQQPSAAGSGGGRNTSGAKSGWFPGNFVKPFAGVRNA